MIGLPSLNLHRKSEGVAPQTEVVGTPEPVHAPISSAALIRNKIRHDSLVAFSDVLSSGNARGARAKSGKSKIVGSELSVNSEVVRLCAVVIAKS
jgi:hypothetical protein